ncbi:MAG: hypothetical protein JW798_15265, partial [Prolixibacteraceae bacterium]|nr:hypothetical protein [Prolixibacteraceae bacterium]
MKRILLLIFSIFVVQFGFSQKPHFIKSDKVLNVGIGYDYYPLGSMSLDYCIAEGIVEVASIG